MSRKSKQQITEDRIAAGVKISRLEAKNLISSSASKKYFAKYLPIEGEIINGDMYIDTDGNINVAIIPGYYKNPHVGYFDGYQKVKLFLCSRDIQLGDEVVSQLKNLPSGKVGAFTSESKQTFCFEGDNSDDVRALHSIHNYGKVIGEISPEAIWVKEGDQFESKDLLALSFGGSSVRRRIEDIDKERFPLEHIWIKGPCGHFH